MSADIQSIELRLLSSLTFDPTDAHRCVSEGLLASDFSDPEHGAIFAAICKLATHADPIDAESLAVLVPSIGKAKIIAVICGEPTSTHRKRLSAIVSAASKNRRVETALKCAQEALQPIEGKAWSETWEAVEPHLRKANEIAAGTMARSRSDVLAEARKLLGPADTNGLQGPFHGWDIASRKLQPGQLCVLAARPGVGKSALALQYATACAQSGLTPLVFSLEMTEEELLARLAVQAAQSSDQRETLPALEVVAKRPYSIFDVSAASTMSQIEARSKLACATSKVGLIIVDYLQLITPPTDMKGANREQQVAQMSRRFKLLAGSLRVPILLLAQLSRESEKEERMPRLSDLRESGAIEQDADCVWFLHREDAHATGDNIQVRLMQAKRRNWTPGVFASLWFNGPTLTFQP